MTLLDLIAILKDCLTVTVLLLVLLVMAFSPLDLCLFFQMLLVYHFVIYCSGLYDYFNILYFCINLYVFNAVEQVSHGKALKYNYYCSSCCQKGMPCFNDSVNGSVMNDR